MKWMLIVIMFNGSPVKTNLLFNTLDDCLAAEESMRKEYAIAYNKWMTWAKENPSVSGFPDSEEFMKGRIGLRSQGTCIPHGQISN